MTTDDLVLQTLRNSCLSEELRDAELDELAKFIVVRDYKAGETVLEPDDAGLQDTLLIIGSGNVEATATAGGEKVTVHQFKPGELAGILGFVGGNMAQVSATVRARTDSRVLLLNRAHFETLLNTQPAIVYYVMRGIVRHVQGIVRRMNMRTAQMNNYIFQQGERY